MAFVRTRSSHQQRNLLVALLLLVAIIAALQATGRIHLFHREPKAAGGASFESKGEPSSSSTKNSSLSQSSAQGGANESSKSLTSNQNLTLIDPSGDFVSAHNVNSSTLISSVCNTTPGATCQITFTNGSETKSLSNEMTDSNGSVYWNAWTPKDIGLSPGSWQITATALLGSQTKTSNDSLPLEVSQ